jgi:hypothetical protein
MSPEALEIIQTIGAFIFVLIILFSIRIIAVVIGFIITMFVGAGSIVIVVAGIVAVIYFGIQHFIPG